MPWPPWLWNQISPKMFSEANPRAKPCAWCLGVTHEWSSWIRHRLSHPRSLKPRQKLFANLCSKTYPLIHDETTVKQLERWQIPVFRFISCTKTKLNLVNKLTVPYGYATGLAHDHAQAQMRRSGPRKRTQPSNFSKIRSCDNNQPMDLPQISQNISGLLLLAVNKCA